MTTIVEDLKTKLLHARKQQDQFNVIFLSTLLSEVEMIGKNKGNRETTDEEAVKHMKSWIASNELVMSESISEDGKNKLLRENEFCQNYLPVMLTEEQLTGIIVKYIQRFGMNQGLVMKELKSVYPNQYDGKMATAIYKTEIINEQEKNNGLSKTF